MQLWPATIASPSREVGPHGSYNYSLLPRQKTRRRWTFFWSLERLKVPFLCTTTRLNLPLSRWFPVDAVRQRADKPIQKDCTRPSRGPAP